MVVPYFGILDIPRYCEIDLTKHGKITRCATTFKRHYIAKESSGGT